MEHIETFLGRPQDPEIYGRDNLYFEDDKRIKCKNKGFLPIIPFQDYVQKDFENKFPPFIEKRLFELIDANTEKFERFFPKTLEEFSKVAFFFDYGIISTVEKKNSVIVHCGSVSPMCNIFIDESDYEKPVFHGWTLSLPGTQFAEYPKNHPILDEIRVHNLKRL